MFIIVGLGNPGSKYEKTRHNLGFMVLDKIARDQDLIWEKDHDSLIAKVDLNGTKIILAKPQTMMNRSGSEVSRLMRFYKIDTSNLIVVHDEVDLPFGTVRNALGSGSAGHNGVQSIIDSLATKNFQRVRGGIGKPEKGDFLGTDDWVLSDFSEEELNELPKFIDTLLSVIRPQSVPQEPSAG